MPHTPMHKTKKKNVGTRLGPGRGGDDVIQQGTGTDTGKREPPGSRPHSTSPLLSLGELPETQTGKREPPGTAVLGLTLNTLSPVRGTNTLWGAANIGTGMSIFGSLAGGVSNYNVQNASANAMVSSQADIDKILALNLGELDKNIEAHKFAQEFNEEQIAQRRRVVGQALGLRGESIESRRSGATETFSLRAGLSDLDRSRISTDLTESLTNLGIKKKLLERKRDKAVSAQRARAGAGGVRLSGSTKRVTEDIGEEAGLILQGTAAERTGVLKRSDIAGLQIDTEEAIGGIVHGVELDRLDIEERQADFEFTNAIFDIDLDLETSLYNTEIAIEREKTRKLIEIQNAAARSNNLARQAEAFRIAGNVSLGTGVLEAGATLFGSTIGESLMKKIGSLF